MLLGNPDPEQTTAGYEPRPRPDPGLPDVGVWIRRLRPCLWLAALADLGLSVYVCVCVCIYTYNDIYSRISCIVLKERRQLLIIYVFSEGHTHSMTQVSLGG